MKNSLEHPLALCVNRGATNEQHTMNTDTYITYSPAIISERIDSMVSQNTNVFLIITHRKSVSYTYGPIKRCLNDSFRCDSPDGLSYTVFSPDDIEAIGSTCIWLKP